MNIFTVSSRDSTDLGEDFFVEGSYTNWQMAVEKAAEYIFDRIDFRLGFAHAMANDENHPEAKSFFSVRHSDGTTVVRKGCVAKLKEYLRSELDRFGMYDISAGTERYKFDIDKNLLVGEVWRTVTFGDSDNEDPQFTTPWPEAFSTKEAALKEFVDYVKDLFKQHGMRYTRKDETYIHQQVDACGKVQVDLNDGCCVCLVLNHDDAVNVKG